MGINTTVLFVIERFEAIYYSDNDCLISLYFREKCLVYREPNQFANSWMPHARNQMSAN